jgi:hypothetical protein
MFVVWNFISLNHIKTICLLKRSGCGIIKGIKSSPEVELKENLPKTNAPCIVNEGTLINKRDIIRALETLENVGYEYRVDNKTMAKGEGWILKIFASRESSTLIINDCIYINVLSFDYLRFYRNKTNQTIAELVNDTCSLKMTALEESQRIIEKIERNILSHRRVIDEEEICPYLLEDEDFGEED